MTAHTPGPWGYVPASPGFQARVCAPPLEVDPVNATLIAGVGAGRDTSVDLINANARLIAAAPELLNILKETLVAIRDFSDEHESDPFRLSCPACDGALPLSHSLGCRIKNAIWKATHEPQAVAQ